MLTSYIHGGETATAIAWHVRALAIRLVIGVPETVNDLRFLNRYRRGLGSGQFTSLLNSTTAGSGLADAITRLLDQMDRAGADTD